MQQGKVETRLGAIVGGVMVAERARITAPVLVATLVWRDERVSWNFAGRQVGIQRYLQNSAIGPLADGRGPVDSVGGGRGRPPGTWGSAPRKRLSRLFHNL
jgi:hypothetical protein